MSINKSIKILFIFIFLALHLFGQETKNVIVANSNIPLFKETKLELIPNIEINIKNIKLDDESYIYQFIDIAVDQDRNIFLITNNNILKFDKTGKSLADFLITRGEGPKEFRMFPRYISLDASANLYLPDGYKIVKLNAQLKYLEDLKLLVRGTVCVDKNGFIYALKNEFSKEGLFISLSKFDKKGNLLKKFTGCYEKNFQTTGGIAFSVTNVYSQAYYFNMCSDGLIYASNLEYKLYKYDLEGKLAFAITLDENPGEISSKEKNFIVEKTKKSMKLNVGNNLKMNFPDNRPFFKKILIDEKDRIYVIRLKSIMEEENGEVIDIFSKDGKYLYKVTIPFEPLIIKNGFVYFIEKTLDNDDDYIYKVKCFEIKNYNLFR